MKSRALRISVASLVGAGLLLAAPFVMARDVNWSVGIGSRGPAVVYAPPPVVYVQPQPVYVQPQPVYESGPIVEYGRVYYYYEAPPRHHYRHGHRHGYRQSHHNRDRGHHYGHRGHGY